MSSLNHVCMWEGHGWKRITAEEAAKRYPYGTMLTAGFSCANYAVSMSV